MDWENTSYVTSTHKASDIIFNQSSLKQFMSTIKGAIKNNHTIISLMALYNKVQTGASLTEDEQNVKDNVSNWESKRFNYNVLINKSYNTTNKNRYQLFQITDYTNLNTGPTVGSLNFIRNSNTNKVLVNGFTSDGHFNNDKSDFTIRDLNARNINLSGKLTYNNSTLEILSTAEAVRRSLIRAYTDVTKNIDHIYITQPETIVIKDTNSLPVTITTGNSVYNQTTKTVTATVTLGKITGDINNLSENKWVTPKTSTGYYAAAGEHSSSGIDFNSDDNTITIGGSGAATTDSYTFTAISINQPLGSDTLIGKCTIDNKDYFKKLTTTEIEKFCAKKIMFKSSNSSSKVQVSLPISNDTSKTYPLWRKTDTETYEPFYTLTYYDDFDYNTTGYIFIQEASYTTIKTPLGRPGKTIFPNGLNDSITNYQLKTSTGTRDVQWSDLLQGSIITAGGISAAKSIMGYRVHGAVFNDYAEFRHTENVKPGMCVIEDGKGGLAPSTKRLELGANIVSDTYGFSIGETSYANTPIAVCGRVLAYPWEHRELFKPGEAVCSGPNGTISRMTRDEIRYWPDAIVGYVSEIPDYEEWGSDKVKVNGRIWIKVK